jgi:hypothetical protein
MALKIITADARRANAAKRGSIFVVGEPGVGKTCLLWGLPEQETLALDFEGGFKSVSSWGGDSFEIRTFLDAADIACLIGGGDPALPDNELLSSAHYNAVKDRYADFNIDKYGYIFFDSISELSFAAWQYARQQPRAFNDKGAFDPWGAYGTLAENMTTMIRHMQHSNKNIIFVGRLEMTKAGYKPQLEGAKTAKDLPYIVDQVVSMSFFDYANGGWTHNPHGGEYRAFCCRANNPFGLPAKERTLGNVEMIEEAHIGKLMAKINQPVTAAAGQALNSTLRSAAQ